MTEVLQSPSHFPSSPNTSSTTSSSSPTLLISTHHLHNPQSGLVVEEEGCGGSIPGICDLEEEVKEREKQNRDQLSLLALVVTLCRKSLIACKSDRRELCSMEIGWPTNVRHVAHVTFDRFNGFLGLPVEFEPEVSRRAPSASATVFGVSTESMQLSYDCRGNSVPTILLLMQRCLYAQGGLQAEGIFRINAGNSQEEYVRDQLNRGLVPEGIDVHCLAGLIKAWFRELPNGVLDTLSPEQVIQCQTEEDCTSLVRLLAPTEAALLDWAINLMADVVQHEHFNKMNTRNIAMVFAPNMTQMADPLTALMYAVQVMNFLKTLIIRTLREREDSIVEPTPAYHLEPSDESGNQSPSFLSCTHDIENYEKEIEHFLVAEVPVMNCVLDTSTDSGESGKVNVDRDQSSETQPRNENNFSEKVVDCEANYGGYSKMGQSSDSSLKKGLGEIILQQHGFHMPNPVEKTKGVSNLRHIDSRKERIEAWR